MNSGKRKRSLLWKIQPPGLEKPSYLFGTMHVKDQRAFHFQEEVYRCIDECDAFALEFDLKEANASATAEAMDLASGQKLSTLLSERHFAKLQKLFAKLTGMDLMLFDSSQPLLVTNLLTESILSKDRAVVLDHQLWQYATEQEKLTLGIESFEEQLAILGQIPLEIQLKSLISVAKNFKKFRKHILKMTALYEEGDIHKLHKSSRKSLKGLRKLMLYDRNERMAERIYRLASEQSVCAAIGAGHLGGKKGVVKLLKAQGCKLKPIHK
ncbi:MAG: TraB/GumN family protein [Bacteroidota bacterium]